MTAVYAQLRVGARPDPRMPRLVQGSTVRWYADLRDTETRAPTPTAGVAFTVERPGGAEIVFSGVNVQSDAPGVHWVEFELDAPGIWSVEVAAPGSVRSDLRSFLVGSNLDSNQPPPAWVDQGSGVVVTPAGEPISATLLGNLPDLGQPQAGDRLAGARAGAGGRFDWASLETKATDAAVVQMASYKRPVRAATLAPLPVPQNLAPDSEAFEGAAWTRSRMSVTAGQADPDGGTRARLVIPTAVNGTHVVVSAARPYVAGRRYVFAKRVKASGPGFNWLRLSLSSTIFGTSNEVNFDTANGVVGLTDVGVTAGMTALGNGWFLAWAHMVAGADGNATVSWVINQQNQAFFQGSTGDGVNGQLWYGDQWGERITEAGVYVRTTGTPVLPSGVRGPTALDGISLSAGDRMLVKSQALFPEFNGIYVHAGADAMMSRAADADTADKLVNATVPVEAGAVNGLSRWRCTMARGAALGVAAINWLPDAARPNEALSLRDYGATGDGVTDDTAAVQAAVTAATTLNRTLLGTAGTYRCTGPIRFGSNFRYQGQGATFVKDYAGGYSEALFVNSTYNTTTRVENVILRDLWLSEPDSTKGGTLLSIVTGRNILIDGLHIDKKGGSWAVVFAADDARINNSRIYTGPGVSFGDGIHITYGENIVIDNCIVISQSDDAIAIHPHQNTWTTNGQFNGATHIVNNVVISNCVLNAPTQSIRIGASETDNTSDGEPNPIGSVIIQGCQLPGGAKLEDHRDTVGLPMNGPIIFDGCTFDEDVFFGVNTASAPPRYSLVVFNNCTMRDNGTNDAIDMETRAVERMRIQGCTINSSIKIKATDEVAIIGSRIQTNTQATGIDVSAPRFIMRASQLHGSTQEFRGILLSNNGAAVTYAAVQSCLIRDVERGLGSANGIAYLNAEGTDFFNCPAGEITGTVTTGRFSLSTTAGHPLLKTYTVATLPGANPAGQMIQVSNGSNNRRLAISDGTAWRFPDGAVVS